MGGGSRKERSKGRRGKEGGERRGEGVLGGESKCERGKRWRWQAEGHAGGGGAREGGEVGDRRGGDVGGVQRRGEKGRLEGEEREVREKERDNGDEEGERKRGGRVGHSKLTYGKGLERFKSSSPYRKAATNQEVNAGLHQLQRFSQKQTLRGRKKQLQEKAVQRKNTNQCHLVSR